VESHLLSVLGVFRIEHTHLRLPALVAPVSPDRLSRWFNSTQAHHEEAPLRRGSFAVAIFGAVL
jgi:hypothetical protein